MNCKTVSILGCGWVGKALHLALTKEEYKTQCLSRNIEENNLQRFYDCDTFVIAIAPRENYITVLKKTLALISAKTQVILLSSISFYKAKPLVVEAETLVLKLHDGVAILRLGGLMGYNRIAGKYTAGKVMPSQSSTNYVHRDDVVGIIVSIIDQHIKHEIFDVVAPLQCSKKEIFTQNAKRFGFEKTIFLADVKAEKIFNPAKLCKTLAYTFVKKDVRDFWC